VTLSASIMYLYVLCLVMGLTASIKVMKIVDSVPSCSVELWLGQMMSSTIG
jgi:hypothetical protein